MKRIVIATLPLLLLAACSGGDSGNNSSGGAAQPQVQEPENLTEDPFNMASPYTPPSPSPVAALPSGFDGRWVTPAGNCANGTGVLTVTGTNASVDGATVTLGALDTHGGNSVTAHVLTPGRPAHEERWSVSGDGRQLIRQETDPVGAVIYNRCPA